MTHDSLLMCDALWYIRLDMKMYTSEKASANTHTHTNVILILYDIRGKT